ncbi:regulatory protein RecX [Mangrovibacterium lignilyticum]|uniref:regulatory protein RecX n=1 Tax=Mangrovibacterium lignilyticum TaxID=2668052 RepID=UPI0013D15760|nr:regulatory protein RecX [Mangrovibacterium lignilyticum]
MSQFNEKQKDAFARLAALCSRAEKSPGAIQKKLFQWDLSEEEADPVMQRLFAEKYLDEERFARSYVRDKFRFNHWGKVKIAFQLKTEKIAASVIEMALDEIDEADYRETVRGLMSEKIRKTKAANQYDLKAKVFRFAQSRGFETDLVFSVFEELTKA